MDVKDILSGLEALEQRARIAERKINYSSQLDRLERRVRELEQKLNEGGII